MIPETMRAAVLEGPATMRVREVPIPRLAPHQVLLRVEAVGICGTDFHIYSGEANYNFDARGKPIPFAEHNQVLGHEFTGEIVAVGDQVTQRETGQRVVVDQGVSCVSRGRAPRCEYCASGDSHQCEQYEEHGITGLQGGLADYVAVSAASTVPLTSSLEPAIAAMTEPLGCILHSTDMVARSCARYRINDPDPAHRLRTTLICGAGPAGLLFTQMLRNVSSYEGLLLVSDPDPDKRALALGYGADHALDPSQGDLVEQVLELTKGRRAEYLIEATGSGPLFEEIPVLIRGHATLLLYGHGHGGASLETLNRVQWREPVMVSPIGASGAFGDGDEPIVYSRSLALLEEGRIDVSKFLTHRFRGLEDAEFALTDGHRVPGYIKGVIELGRS